MSVTRKQRACMVEANDQQPPSWFSDYAVKALNQARLEATVKASGDGRRKMVWPTPYTVVCGVLLLVSFLNPFYGPLKWFAVAAAAVGMPPTVLRSLAAIRRLTVDINILLLIAGKF